MNTYEKVKESNRIEGILREPTPEEIAEHDRLMAVEETTIDELVRFVRVYQPDAHLRNKEGMDVRVGNYYPPPGSEYLPGILSEILIDAQEKLWTPFEIHAEYEGLHPFTDGNGRSGRALWWWCMRGNKRADELGFLHTFYYQTLDHYGNMG